MLSASRFSADAVASASTAQLAGTVVNTTPKATRSPSATPVWIAARPRHRAGERKIMPNGRCDRRSIPGMRISLWKVRYAAFADQFSRAKKTPTRVMDLFRLRTAEGLRVPRLRKRSTKRCYPMKFSRVARTASSEVNSRRDRSSRGEKRRQKIDFDTRTAPRYASDPSRTLTSCKGHPQLPSAVDRKA